MQGVDSNMGLLTGMRVLVDPNICEKVFVRWLKSHRKSRINKKWHKKYGATIKCNGVAFEVNGIGLVCCPHFKQLMDKEIKVRNESV